MDSVSDIALLQQWRDGRNAHAFNTLAQRYGGLVFGICNRVLKNGADAEEVTQECFLKLATHPRPPERSLGPWLHSVAVRSSLNHIRSESRRRHREAAFEAERAEGERPRAREIIGHVDEAIATLPGPLAHCLVASFLEGKSQDEVARELGLSSRTVRRKTDEAIARVRELLAARGIVTGSGALGIILTDLGTEALPPTLEIALGKLAVGGHSATGQLSNRAVAERAATKGGTLTMKQIIWAVAGISLVAGSILWNERGGGTTRNTVAEQTVYAQRVASPVVTEPTAVTAVNPVATAPSPVTEGATSRSSLPAISDIPTLSDPADFATITGVIEDMAGQPISGARVSALVAGLSLEESDTVSLEGFPLVMNDLPGPLSSQRPHRVMEKALTAPGHQFNTLTNDVGSYHMADIPYRGHTRVLAEADGFAPMMKRTELAVAEEETMHFALRSARPLRGRILNPTGGGIKGARVAVTGTRSQHGGGGSSRSPLPEPFWTETDGAGHFTLWIADAEWATLVVHSDTHGKGAFYDVPVGTEESVPLPLASRMGALRGQLLLSNTEPARGYYIHVAGALHRADTPEPEKGPRFALDGSRFEIQTDTEGNFEIAPIPTNEDYEAAIYDESGKKVGDAALPVLMPKVVTPWTHRIATPEQLSGTVIAEGTKKGMANVLVRAIFASDLGHPGLDIDSTMTNADGTFHLALYAGAGEYLVQATTDPYAGVTHDPHLFESVVVKRGKPSHITLPLPERWSRQFRVVAPHGTPISDATVRLSQSGPHGGSLRALRDTNTDATGAFHFDQLAGNGESTFTFAKAGFLDTESATLAAADGSGPTEEIITMYPAATALLRVLDTAGFPLADTKLFLTSVYGAGTQRSIDVTSDAQGWVILRDWLPATVVELHLRLPGESTAEGTIRFVGGNGPPSLAMRERMAALSVEMALEQNTPFVRLDDVALEAGMETDLGEVRLEVSAETPSVQ